MDQKASAGHSGEWGAELTSGRHDSAILKIEIGQLPFVKMGGLSEVKEGDDLSFIITWSGVEEMLFSARVSLKSAMKIPEFGPLAINTIVVQAPIKKGFSGAPVFNNATGNVVGFIDTKAGLSKKLVEIRKEFKKQTAANVTIKGVEIGDANIALIDFMEEEFIGGLGTAVDASYIQEVRGQTKDNIDYKKP
jgi:hypothetical protein